MPPTFGDQLKLFALSVDVMSLDRSNRVNRLIDEYCRETLGIEFTKLHLAHDVEGTTERDGPRLSTEKRGPFFHGQSRRACPREACPRAGGERGAGGQRVVPALPQEGCHDRRSRPGGWQLCARACSSARVAPLRHHEGLLYTSAVGAGPQGPRPAGPWACREAPSGAMP